jgi:hypothetical protein
VWVRGRLRRRELGVELRSRLVGKAPLVRAGLYAQGLFWQETVVTVLGERLVRPLEWRELLGSVGLGDWGAVPVVDGVVPGPGPTPVPKPIVNPVR